MERVNALEAVHKLMKLNGFRPLRVDAHRDSSSGSIPSEALRGIWESEKGDPDELIPRTSDLLDKIETHLAPQHPEVNLIPAIGGGIEGPIQFHVSVSMSGKPVVSPQTLAEARKRLGLREEK